MAITPQCFVPRQRRPSAAAFISPQLSGTKLIKALVCLTQEITSLKPLQCLLKQHSASIIRKVKLLSMVLEQIMSNNEKKTRTSSQSAALCFEEMYIVLERIKALMEDCREESKMWLLITIETGANTFNELTLELGTVLDVFPVNQFELNQDIKEILVLVRKQCSKSKALLNPIDEFLREQVLTMLRMIKREIVPDHSKLSLIFQKLDLSNSKFCTQEIQCLEDEIPNQNNHNSKFQLFALIAFVRYANCVLFGPHNVPRADTCRRLDSTTESNIPADFRCPVTLELMRDPVVVATGQTYDRESITSWISSGHNTCPKTGQRLAHTKFITNQALRNLIGMWCREHRIPLETVGIDAGNNGLGNCKATKMTVSFLVSKLASLTSLEAANCVVYELRHLAKTDSDSRVYIAEAGAIPLFVRYLCSDIGLELPNLQVNVVTTILNLSILEANKMRIMETYGALNGIVDVLCSGATWEAKANAAATIFHLSSVSSYRKRLGRKTSVVTGLINLVKDGPTWSKEDALVTILNLAVDRETVRLLVEGGVVEIVSQVQVFDEYPKEVVMIIELVVKRGGIVAVIAAFGTIRKLGTLLRDGVDRVKESVAAALVTICRHGGYEMVVELATLPGIERTIWELSGTGTSRARSKASSLLRILRRWAAGLDGRSRIVNGNTVDTNTMLTPTRTMLLS